LKTPLALVSLTLLLPAAARAAEGTMSAAASTPAGKNMVWNGAFDGEHLRPWSVMFDSPRYGSAAVTSGELCFKLAEPSRHGVDVVLRQRPIALAKGHHYPDPPQDARHGADQGARAPVQDQRPVHGDVGRHRRRGRDREDLRRDVRRDRRRRQHRAGHRIRRPADRQGSASRSAWTTSS
jgi:hypothetical protein